MFVFLFRTRRLWSKYGSEEGSSEKRRKERVTAKMRVLWKITGEWRRKKKRILQKDSQGDGVEVKE